MTGPLFAVVGEALIDIGPDGVARPGGSPLNVAVGLARLGQPTALLGRFGADEHSAALRGHATAAGVDLRWSIDTDRPSTTARVHLDGHGVARYEFRVDGTADFGWTDDELTIPGTAHVVHFGSLASWLPPGDAAIDRAVAALRARTAGRRPLLSYDPNVRPGLQPDRARARGQVERSVRHAHLVKASADDLAYLYGAQDPSAIAGRWLAAGGPVLVVITRGRHGALAVTADTELARPAPRVRVVDTVGAGDAFTSGLLDALARRGATDADRLAALGEAELAAVLDAATRNASAACTRAGADPSPPARRPPAHRDRRSAAP